MDDAEIAHIHAIESLTALLRALDRIRYARVMRALLLLLVASFPALACAEFTAGSAITDVTPTTLPVLVNGGMTSRSIDKVKTPLKARSLAFSDGEEKIVIVVVDSCMMPRPLLDEAKEIAAKKADISADHILISATHTHTAGSSMGCLGTDADPVYSLFLKKKLVDAILAPLENMQPARIGWGEIDAADYTALRRWVIHPDHMQEDPFGNKTVRANMHAAANWENVIGPTGPEDPMLQMISVQSAEGEPIGLLANFSMHYFSDRDISADYFGLFANGMQDRVAEGKEGFVAMMSHGCSGDIWRHDYEKTDDRAGNKTTIEDYTDGLLNLAMTAYDGIEYSEPTSIAMDETRLDLAYRVPDVQLLEWAQRNFDEEGENPPKDKTEVYAREQILLHKKQRTEVVVQALRLGDDISIATTPNETYAITGLKIKNASPTEHTMTIELANGGDGYIPPPEQHLLGGYNTWAARSAGLEVEAEPKIAAAAIGLLEKVTTTPRADRRPGNGSAAEHILSLKPKAYYRLDEFNGPLAHDASPNHLDAIYEPQVLFWLEGPHAEAFSVSGVNRAAHFVDDRLRVRVPGLEKEDYSVSFWFWSGTANSKIDPFEWIFSRGHELSSLSNSVNIGLTDKTEGNLRHLVYVAPGVTNVLSQKALERWKWYHLAFVQSSGETHLYLNGEKFAGPPKSTGKAISADTLFFGGSAGNDDNFEGKLDEIAIFDRSLSDDEIKNLYKISSTK